MVPVHLDISLIMVDVAVSLINPLTLLVPLVMQ